jgi:hypothetical protein
LKTVPAYRLGWLLIAACVLLSPAKIAAQPAITDVKDCATGQVVSHDGGRTWLDQGSSRGTVSYGPTPQQLEEQRLLQEAEAEKAKGIELFAAGQWWAAHDYFMYAMAKAPNDPVLRDYAQKAMQQIMAQQRRVENGLKKKEREIAEQQRRLEEAARSLAAQQRMGKLADARARADEAAAGEQRPQIESLADSLENEPAPATDAGEQPLHKLMIQSAALAQAQGALQVWNQCDLQTINLAEMSELKNLVFDTAGPRGSGRLVVVDESSGRKSPVTGPVADDPRIQQLGKQQAEFDRQLELMEASRKAILLDPEKYPPTALTDLLAKQGTIQGQRNMAEFRLREEAAKMANIPRFTVP